jgi:hypothetical protein
MTILDVDSCKIILKYNYMNIANANGCFAIIDTVTIPLETTGIKENSIAGRYQNLPEPNTRGIYH